MELFGSLYVAAIEILGVLFLECSLRRNVLDKILPTLWGFAVTFVPFSNFFIIGFQLVIPCYFFPFLDITLKMDVNLSLNKFE